MFHILSETIKEHVLQKIRKANFFSILCDEVYDISNKEQLISFVQYFDQDCGRADVKFLAVNDVLKNLLLQMLMQSRACKTNSGSRA